MSACPAAGAVGMQKALSAAVAAVAAMIPAAYLLCFDRRHCSVVRRHSLSLASFLVCFDCWLQACLGHTE